MSHFFLVRHGETIWHAENRYAGSTDIALTSKGEQQSLVLRDWAVNAPLTHLFASTMRRAIATATPTAQATGLSLHTDVRLREISFGRGEGLTSAEMKTQFPVEHAAFLRDPATHFLPGGEPPAEAVHRARTVLNEIGDQAGPQARVLVVAHNTLIRLLLCDLLGIPLARYRDLFPRLNNTALTEIELTRESGSLLSFNVPLQ